MKKLFKGLGLFTFAFILTIAVGGRINAMRVSAKVYYYEGEGELKASDINAGMVTFAIAPNEDLDIIDSENKKMTYKEVKAIPSENDVICIYKYKDVEFGENYEKGTRTNLRINLLLDEKLKIGFIGFFNDDYDQDVPWTDVSLEITGNNQLICEGIGVDNLIINNANIFTGWLNSSGGNISIKGRETKIEIDSAKSSSTKISDFLAINSEKMICAEKIFIESPLKITNPKGGKITKHVPVSVNSGGGAFDSVYYTIADADGNKVNNIIIQAPTEKNNDNNNDTTTKDKLNIAELSEQEAKTTKDKVLVILGDGNGYSLFTYDITLVNEQGVAYTKENFPAGGVDVVIPYPKGMNKSNYKYRLFHFANGVNGEATEIKPLELTDKGIKFHANSLSPFVLTVQKADTTKSPKAGESNAFVLSMLGIIAVAGMGLYAGKRQEN